MGRKKHLWQDVDYALRYFDDTTHRTRKGYSYYVEAGVEQGHLNELTEGGLIRSLGRWSEVRKYDLKGQESFLFLGGSQIGDFSY